MQQSDAENLIVNYLSIIYTSMGLDKNLSIDGSPVWLQFMIH